MKKAHIFFKSSTDFHVTEHSRTTGLRRLIFSNEANIRFKKAHSNRFIRFGATMPRTDKQTYFSKVKI